MIKSLFYGRTPGQCRTRKKLIGILVVNFLMLLSRLYLPAQSPANEEIERMQASTVLIIASSGASSGSGTGFVVGDGQYIVTNWHVVGNASELLVIVNRTKIKAGIKVKSQSKDLAVLELEHKIDRPDVVFAPASFVRPAQQVYAMGFPGAAMGDNVDLVSSITEVKISDGIIGARNVKSTNGTSLYQTNAAINPGNSGGPLFNLCGQVVGINVMKSMAQVITTTGEAVRVPKGEGIGWAVKADELFPLLDQAGISYRKAGGLCVPKVPDAAGHDPLMIIGLLTALILAGIAVFMAATAKGRQVIRSTFGTIGAGKSKPKPASPHKDEPKITPQIKPLLRGIAGQYAGVEIQLNDEPLSIGRDPNMSQLVLSEGKDWDQVSGRHCTLSYDFKKNRFYLEDNWSTNGTFLESGLEVKGDKPVHLYKATGFI